MIANEALEAGLITIGPTRTGKSAIKNDILLIPYLLEICDYDKSPLVHDYNVKKSNEKKYSRTYITRLYGVVRNHVIPNVSNKTRLDEVDLDFLSRYRKKKTLEVSPRSNERFRLVSVFLLFFLRGFDRLFRKYCKYDTADTDEPDSDTHIEIEWKKFEQAPVSNI